jgi:FkbM family methyltransferase
MSEIVRGIRDYLTIDSPLGSTYYRLLGTNTLDVPTGESITFVLENHEDFCRSEGGGELSVLADFAARVSTSDTVWDIGANIGPYSLVADAADADQVLAFEPGADAGRKLTKNMKINDAQLDIRQTALSNENTTMTLVDTARSGHRRLSSRESSDGDEVYVRRGDDISAPSPDIIKIDVEGQELDVLDGLSGRLQHTRLVYVELHGGVDRKAVEERLREAGLSVIEEVGSDILRASTHRLE